MKMYKGVILDLDGTLVDSNDAHAEAWVEAFKKYGFQIPKKKIRPLIGMGGDKIVPHVLGPLEDQRIGDEIRKVRGEIFKRKYLAHVKAFKGSSELLRKMQGCGLKLVIGSSAQKDELQDVLKKEGLSPYISDCTSQSDVQDSKPDPDIIESALRKLSLNPDEVLMLGDTPYDVEAAHRAGVETVAVLSGGHTPSDLSGALALYESPQELLEKFDNSPFRRHAQ